MSTKNETRDEKMKTESIQSESCHSACWGNLQDYTNAKQKP